MLNAPNTPAEQITLAGPYHSVARGTVCDDHHNPHNCLKCKLAANPAHTVNGHTPGSLKTFCYKHCPTCLRFRFEQSRSACSAVRELTKELTEADRRFL